MTWKSITSPISAIIVCEPSFNCSQSHFKGFLQEFQLLPSLHLTGPILTEVGMTEMVMPSKLLLLNSSPTDERGNWCHQRLEGLPIENTRHIGEVSMASCKWPLASTITVKELQWSYLHIPKTNVDLGRVVNKIEKQ